jgi:hydrocephalus-inducing protein
MKLKDCQLLLKIVNGPTYNLAITGEAVPPAVNLSFETHDFGACFLYRPGLPIQEKTLLIKNMDSKPLSLECQYENTKHLEVIATTSMVAPGEAKEVIIRFFPRELTTYAETIPFEVNGLSTINLKVLGQGTEMDVTVAN